MENQDRPQTPSLYSEAWQNKSARTVGDPVASPGGCAHVSADRAFLWCEVWASASHATHVLRATAPGAGALMALTADNYGQTLIEGSHWRWAADGHFGQGEQC